MNKLVIVIISVLILVAFIETRPRHRHRHRHKSWYKYISSSEESSENNGVKSCQNCTLTNIGNGYKNHNIIYYKSKPKSKTQNTETKNEHHHSHRHHSHRHHRYESDESDEDQSNTNSCKDCTVTNIGNGEHNYNIIYYR